MMAPKLSDEERKIKKREKARLRQRKCREKKKMLARARKNAFKFDATTNMRRLGSSIFPYVQSNTSFINGSKIKRNFPQDNLRNLRFLIPSSSKSPFRPLSSPFTTNSVPTAHTLSQKNQVVPFDSVPYYSPSSLQDGSHVHTVKTNPTVCFNPSYANPFKTQHPSFAVEALLSMCAP